VEKEKRNERGFGQYVVIDSSVVRDATFLLTIPWHPSDTLRGLALDSAIKYELRRPDHEIRRTREGFARTWRWRRMDANLGFSRIADPDTVGRLVRIRKLSFAEADPPFQFRNVSGTMLNLGDSVFVDADHFDLPGSTGKGHGSVVWGSDLPVRYYVHVDGDSVRWRMSPGYIRRCRRLAVARWSSTSGAREIQDCSTTSSPTWMCGRRDRA
jgi:hypothetical protein